MPIYSHSQLSMYEQCPLKYKLCYRDKIKRGVEGIEGFMGTITHETLKKCYDDARIMKLNSLEAILDYYDTIWQRDWHDSIVIVKKDLTQDHYRNLGKKLVEQYYHRHAPFNSDVTIATEMMLNFSLDDTSDYRLVGYIDRLSRTEDGIHQVHDYKTSGHLPGQEDADRDRQLGLYQIGIRKKWPDIDKIELIWHYLAFDRELVSTRSAETISKLTTETKGLIDEIKAVDEFLPRESALCDWCEYPDLCPLRKHLYTVEALPVNEYLNEPGVTLVNKYAELKEQASEINDELEKVKEAIIEYARREQVEVIRGSDRKARVKFDKQLKFPRKNEPERQQLDDIIIEAGKWSEVSQLDTNSLTRIVESGTWDKDLIDQVMQFGKIEESSTIYISKLKDEEK